MARMSRSQPTGQLVVTLLHGVRLVAVPPHRYNLRSESYDSSNVDSDVVRLGRGQQSSSDVLLRGLVHYCGAAMTTGLLNRDASVIGMPASVAT